MLWLHFYTFDQSSSLLLWHKDELALESTISLIEAPFPHHGQPEG
jgi:hypothetical protein